MWMFRFVNDNSSVQGLDESREWDHRFYRRALTYFLVRTVGDLSSPSLARNWNADSAGFWMFPTVSSRFKLVKVLIVRPLFSRS